MSSSVQLTTENGEPETQFNNGIKMIVSAYETQTNLLSNEISMLNAELEKKNAKISEMEELCSSLLKEKSEYESKISSLSSTNAQLTQQLDILISENKELKSVKEKILNALERKQPHNKALERELSQPQLLLHKSKTKTNILNGNDFEELIKAGTPSSTAKKNKFVKQGGSAIGSSFKYPKNNTYYTNSSLMPSKSTSSMFNKQSSQSERNSFCETYSFNRNYDYNGNSKNNNRDFFKKCRYTMKSDEYNKMIEIVHLFNSKKISKDETYQKISDILSKGQHFDLIKEFNRLFSS